MTRAVERRRRFPERDADILARAGTDADVDQFAGRCTTSGDATPVHGADLNKTWSSLILTRTEPSVCGDEGNRTPNPRLAK
ncbi:MAG: hypothetical protein ABI808_06290, partial [Pseudonocardiales bacterium]